MTRFFEGLSYNIKGWRYFWNNAVLWKYALVPLCLNIVAAGFFLSLYWHYAGSLYAALVKPLLAFDVATPVTFWQHVADVALWFIRVGLKTIVFVVSLALMAATSFLSASIVNGPFYELLCEHVLILLGRRTPVPFSFKGFVSECLHAFRVELTKAAAFVVVSGALFVLSWIPFVGALFAFAQFVFAAWFFAFGICAYAFVLDKIGPATIFRWGRRNAMRLIGFGLPSLIPLVGLVLSHFQVVGATLLYVDSLDEAIHA